MAQKAPIPHQASAGSSGFYAQPACQAATPQQDHRAPTPQRDQQAFMPQSNLQAPMPQPARQALTPLPVRQGFMPSQAGLAPVPRPAHQACPGGTMGGTPRGGVLSRLVQLFPPGTRVRQAPQHCALLPSSLRTPSFSPSSASAIIGLTWTQSPPSLPSRNLSGSLLFSLLLH